MIRPKRGKIKVELSWKDNNYCCAFKRGGKKEDWQDLTLDEQKHCIGAMVTMAGFFEKFLKKEDEVAK